MTLARSVVKAIIVHSLFFSIILLRVAPTCAQEESPKIVIAAADFQNNSGKSEFDHLSRAIPSSIITNLAAFKQFTIVERSQLDAALNELALIKQGIVDKNTAARVGQHVGATLLIIGDFLIIGNEILINARLVEVTTSEMRAGIRKRGTLAGLLSLLDEISAAIIEELQGEVKEPHEGENQLPTAVFTFSPQRPTSGSLITFDASKSSDPDGDIVLYEWDFDNDGAFDRTGQAVSEIFFTGPYLVTLRVTDNQGGSSSTSQTIQVREGQSLEIGEVAISSDPSNAMIFVNGEFKGVTPKVIAVRSGSYDLVLRKENYEEWRKEIDVEGNQRKEVFVQLTKKTGNHPPTAAFHFLPSLPAEGDRITLDASGSSDPDGFITDYRWDFDGDGVPDAWGLRVYQEFSRGQHTVTLTVIDNEGASSSYTRELWIRKQHVILENSARFDSSGSLIGEIRLSGLSVFSLDVVIFSHLKASGFSDIGFNIIKQIIDIGWFNLLSVTTLDTSGSFGEQLQLSISAFENLGLRSSATFNLPNFSYQYGDIVLRATVEEVRLQGYAYFRGRRFSEGTLEIDEIHVGDFTLSGHVLFYHGGFGQMGFRVRTRFMEIDLSSETGFDTDGFSFEELTVSGIKLSNFALSSAVTFSKTGFGQLTFIVKTNFMVNLISITEFDTGGFHMQSLAISKDFGNIAISTRVEFYPDHVIGFFEIRIVI